MAKGDNGGCVTRQVVTQRCAPEEVEPGRHVYRCEKKIQTFRDCYGRPTEVLQSQTEITDHEMDGNLNYNVQYSMQQSSSSSSSSNWDTDVKYNVTEEFERMTEGIEKMDKFIEGVERMTDGIMTGVQIITEEARRITGSLFGFPSLPGDPAKEEEQEVDAIDEYVMKEQDQVYSEYADKVRDV